MAGNQKPPQMIYRGYMDRGNYEHSSQGEEANYTAECSNGFIILDRRGSVFYLAKYSLFFFFFVFHLLFGKDDDILVTLNQHLIDMLR